MKIPFGQYLGPFFKQYRSQINEICKPCLFGSQIYLTAFSFAGLIITIFELISISGNKISPASLFNCLCPRACPVILKNLKLIYSGFNISCYCMLVIGSMNRYPVFLMPYLTINFFNILLYLFLSLFAISSRKECYELRNVLLIGFMIHNWLQTFCFFRTCLSIGDF